MSKRILAGLDIGTSAIRVVLVGYNEQAEGEHLTLLGFGSAPTEGMRRGMVVEPEDVAKSIRAALRDAEQKTGIAVDHAYISFGGAGLGLLPAKGVVAVSRADGEISEADIERVRAATRSSLPQLPNREILHEIPTSFTVDREVGVKNPLGMIGSRLEAEVLFITAFTPHLRSLIKSVETAGVSIDDIIAAPLASAHATLSKHQKDIGVMSLDLGGGTASMAVFEEGMLVSANIFPVGSMHITNDIAIGFQLPLEIAEQVKVEHGGLIISDSAKKEGVRLADFSSDINATVSKKELSDIIEARATDIFELVEKHLRKIGRSGLLPSGVVLTGGGASLRGITEFARRELRLPANVGTPRLTSSTGEHLIDSGWSVAVGLCVWADEHEPRQTFMKGFSSKLSKRILGWIRPLIP